MLNLYYLSGDKLIIFFHIFFLSRKIYRHRTKKSKNPLTIPTSDLSLSAAPLYGIHGKIHSHKIERVQRAAARYVVNDYDFTSSVTEIPKTLNWQILEQRRIQKSVIKLFKINH